MRQKEDGIKKLAGEDLTGFRIVEMTEVYRIDNDGRKSNTLGFFKNPDVAKSFAGVQTDANWHRTDQALILTNGIIGFVVTESESVKLFDDEEEALKIKEKVLAKLTPAERKLLGY